jgi:threonine dehydratase
MITLSDVQDAYSRIAPYVRRTPLAGSYSVSQALGTNAYLKLELFQRTGSFKPRAAFSKMLRLTEAERQRGPVAVSGGNFAQGVAYAGRTLNIRTTVVMPATTPKNYVEATRAYGAEVELAPDIQSAFDRAEAYAREGHVLLHPYDDPAVMAGDGSIGLELLEDAPQLTDVVVSVGGGGLMSGVVTALKGLKPSIRVWTVETEEAPTLARARQAGRVVRIQPTSLAKTLGAPYIAEAALQIAQQHVTQHVLVSDREAYQAQRFLLERAKVLTELSAASTLAAALHLREHFNADQHVALILCGGNVSLDDLVAYQAMFEGKP